MTIKVSLAWKKNLLSLSWFSQKDLLHGGSPHQPDDGAIFEITVLYPSGLCWEPANRAG
jgi:hypothetical protein